MIIALFDLEVDVQKVDDGEIGCGLPVRHGSGLEREPALGPMGVDKLVALNVSLRHEVARWIVWHVIRTRPVVPSAGSYADVREGPAPYSACGHGTHRYPTGTCTARERGLCQPQAETGLDGG